jgi:hypothetical protein
VPVDQVRAENTSFELIEAPLIERPAQAADKLYVRFCDIPSLLSMNAGDCAIAPSPGTFFHG